eukprot:1086240-Pyramimonas_sp.AAC.1
MAPVFVGQSSCRLLRVLRFSSQSPPPPAVPGSQSSGGRVRRAVALPSCWSSAILIAPPPVAPVHNQGKQSGHYSKALKQTLPGPGPLYIAEVPGSTRGRADETTITCAFKHAWQSLAEE